MTAVNKEKYATQTGSAGAELGTISAYASRDGDGTTTKEESIEIQASSQTKLEKMVIKKTDNDSKAGDSYWTWGYGYVIAHYKNGTTKELAKGTADDTASTKTKNVTISVSSADMADIDYIELKAKMKVQGKRRGTAKVTLYGQSVTSSWQPIN